MMASFDMSTLGTKGCYLTFDAASQGTLFVHWSETPIEGAIAFFAPRKNVPGFKVAARVHRVRACRRAARPRAPPRDAVGPRDATAHTTTALSRASQFKQNGGRSELIREMSGGTGERIKRYYSGWCQYVKLAKSFQAAFVMYAFDVLPMVDIALIDGAKESDNIVPVVVGEPVESLATLSAVGTVPHPNPCFTATTFSKEYFISTGNKEGVALPI